MYFIEALQLCTLCILLINVMFYTEGFHSPIETEPETVFKFEGPAGLFNPISVLFVQHSHFRGLYKNQHIPIKGKKVADCKIRNLLYGFL